MNPVMNSQSDERFDPRDRRESDARLWEQVLNGDQQAFETLVERYQGLVSAVALSHVGNFAWCQEVTQETFWQAWRQRQDLRNHQALAAWLCGIARNMARQVVRHERGPGVVSLYFDPPKDQLDPDMALVSEEDRLLVWQELEVIPEMYREPLVLFYREGMPIAEIADVLELSNDTVKQRLSRGRNRLRDQLATKIEEVLIRSRPGRALTKSIMAGIGVLAATLKVTGSASAAGIGTSIGQGIAGSKTALTAQAVAGGASAGIAGGLIGTLGGLFGAAAGIWVPAQMSPTMAERNFLMKEGRRTIGVALIYTLAIFGACFYLRSGGSLLWFLVLMASSSIAFTAYVIARSLQLNSAIKKIRMHVSAADDPNPSKFRQHVQRIQGSPRSYTSRFRIAGIPVLDIQFSNAGLIDDGEWVSKRAFGWIALGDRATGILFAYGGLATGLIAVGGISCGVISLGGLAIGALAFGGGALGLIALGGLAIGYDAVGGGAIGWHSAAGGGALAGHVAVGGGAMARDFAVGGAVAAQEVNTDLARSIAAQESFSWMLDWMIANQLAFNVGCFVFVAVCLGFRLAITSIFFPNQRDGNI